MSTACRKELVEVATQAAESAVEGVREDIALEVREATETGVTNALERLGVDVMEPLEMQRDFSFIRDFRTTTTSVRKKGLLTICGLIVTAVAAALWIGLRHLFGEE